MSFPDAHNAPPGPLSRPGCKRLAERRDRQGRRAKRPLPARRGRRCMSGVTAAAARSPGRVSYWINMLSTRTASIFWGSSSVLNRVSNSRLSRQVPVDPLRSSTLSSRRNAFN